MSETVREVIEKFILAKRRWVVVRHSSGEGYVACEGYVRSDGSVVLPEPDTQLVQVKVFKQHRAAERYAYRMTTPTEEMRRRNINIGSKKDAVNPTVDATAGVPDRLSVLDYPNPMTNEFASAILRSAREYLQNSLRPVTLGRMTRFESQFL
jgi:hypothetical protein